MIDEELKLISVEVKKSNELEIAAMIKAIALKASVVCLRANPSISLTEIPSLILSVNLFLSIGALLK